MFKSINESFDKKFKNIENEEQDKLVTDLEECLRRINEAEMSDEDKADSDLIRSMLDKIQRRSNAKFSPEEIAVMDKYGIKRDNWRKMLSVDDRDLAIDSDGKISHDYVDDEKTGHWKRIERKNGNPDKINYADRARKLRDRKSSQVQGDGSNSYRQNRDFNRHTSKYAPKLQDVERGVLASRMSEPVRDMEMALRDRRVAQRSIDNADDARARRMADAQSKYDDAKKWADWHYDQDTRVAAGSRERAQKQIDKLLKKDNLTESPVYDMTPQYDARQSFYGKARVDDNGNEKTLYSYNTPVAKIVDGQVSLLPRWDESQTTLRHVKEFLKQNGFVADSLAQMRKTYR